MNVERRSRARRLVLGAALALLLTGCTTITPRAPIPYTGDPLIDGRAQVAAADPRDRVLWRYRLGATALRRGDADEASQQFDAALEQVRGTLAAAGARDAARARGLFRSEADKPFIGEPYERAMASIYRGLLYWRQGEPDNARALFRDAEFIDGDAENRSYAGDWVIPDYLDGLATVRFGGDGTEALARARANSKHPLPDYNPDANVLLFVEFGRGPTKYAAGEYGQQLKFRVDPPRLIAATLTVNGQSFPLPAYDDVGFQATTRGGRVMDHILGNKAVFKEGADVVGDAALAAAVIVANDRDHRRPPPKTKEEADQRRTEERERDQAAVALAAIGIFSKIASAATETRADTRTWDNLPRYLSLATLELPPGDHPAVLTFQDASGLTAASRTQTFTISVPPPVDGRPAEVVIVRSEVPN